MTEEFLYGPNVVAIFQQTSGKGMVHGVWAGWLCVSLVCGLRILLSIQVSLNSGLEKRSVNVIKRFGTRV